RTLPTVSRNPINVNLGTSSPPNSITLDRTSLGGGGGGSFTTFAFSRTAGVSGFLSSTFFSGPFFASSAFVWSALTSFLSSAPGARANQPAPATASSITRHARPTHLSCCRNIVVSTPSARARALPEAAPARPAPPRRRAPPAPPPARPPPGRADPAPPPDTPNPPTPPTPGHPPRRSSRRRNQSRARDSRETIVPFGQRRCRAASSLDRPSR